MSVTRAEFPLDWSPSARPAPLPRVATYLSRGHIECRLKNPSVSEAVGELVAGALLFADITGFTPLSEQLGRRGKEGSEELTGVLNRYFEAMAEVVARHGGDILQFGGDSLLVVFGAASCSKVDASQAVRQAIACALQMQRTMRQFAQVTTSVGSFDLSMSVAIHHGEFLLASAGAWEGHLQQIVLGQALNRLMQAESLARSGEVLLTPDAERLVRGDCTLTDQREQCWVVEGLLSSAELTDGLPEQSTNSEPIYRLDPPAAEEALRPHLIPALYRAIAEDPDGDGADGEHRFIATMFVRFVGMSGLLAELGPGRLDELVRLLDRYLAAMTAVIVRHGGALARISADAEGDKLLVLFGAPTAIENPEQQALRCALELNRRLEELKAESPLPLWQAIGVTCGSAFCGNVGSRRRCEYTVIGDEVNVAARLMGRAAATEILVSRDTRRRAGQLFHFAKRGPLQLKGKSAPLDVDLLVAARTLVSGPPDQPRRLFGRTVECDRAREIAACVRTGQGQILAISGEAGLGKSQLAGLIVAECERDGMAVFWGRCTSFGGSSPYLPWGAILRGLTGIEDHDSTDAVRDKLKRALSPAGGQWAEWSALLGTIIGTRLPDSDGAAALAPRQRREKMFELCRELLRLAARRGPLCLVLEDLHWSDPLSCELLAYLAERLHQHPILILATHRPEFDQTALAGPQLTTIALRPLDCEAILDLLRQLLHCDSLPEELGEFILRKSEGNPFYVEQLVHALEDAGSLVRDAEDGHYRYLHNRQLADLPGTIQGLLLSRVDRLPTGHRRVLQVASVFGKSVSAEALQSALPFSMPPGYPEAVLRDLTRLDLMVIEPRGAAGVYSFRHALIQEVVYESLSFARRRELHRTIGEYLERAGSAGDYEQCGLLAHHFDRAWVSDKALRYLTAAGDHARRAYANREAAACYERALVHWHAVQDDAGLPLRVRLLESLADVHCASGQYHEARGRYLEAVEQAGDAIDRARLEGKLGAVCYRQGQPRNGIAHLERGLAHLGIRMPRTRWGVRASLLRQFLIQAGHTLLPSAFVRDRCRNHEAGRAAAEIYEALSRINFEVDLERTLDAHLRQLNLCETMPGSPQMAQTYSSHGIVCGTIPLFGRAMRYQQRGLALREARGDRWGVAQSSNFMAICHYWRGDLDQAVACLERSARIFHEVGDRWEMQVTYLIHAYIALRRGELASAAQYAMTSLDFSRRAEDWQGMGWALGALADANSRLGKLDEARAQACEALECSTQARDRMYVAVIRRTLGEIALRDGRTGEAVEEMRGGVRQIRDFRLRQEYVVGAWSGLAEALIADLASRADVTPAERRAVLREIRALCRTAVKQGRKFRNWLPSAYRISGLCEWAAGRQRAALNRLGCSVRAAHQLGARYDLAQTYFDLGRVLQELNDPDAERCLGEAERLFQQCGAAWDRQRVEVFRSSISVRRNSREARAPAPHFLGRFVRPRAKDWLLPAH